MRFLIFTFIFSLLYSYSFSQEETEIKGTRILDHGIYAAEQVASVREQSIHKIHLDGKSLTVNDMFVFIESKTSRITLDSTAAARAQANHDQVMKWLKDGRLIYGITAALGPLKDIIIKEKDQHAFAVSTLLSNASGIGKPFPDDIARLAMLLRANAAATGKFAGVRPELIHRYIDFINAGVVPLMNQRGSLGIGDLQPQADLGLVLIGNEHGRAKLDEREGPAPEILRRAGLPDHFELGPGEALAIISGNAVVTAGAVHALYRTQRLLHTVNCSYALFMEATRAKWDPLDPRTHESRNIPGEVRSAARTRALVEGSQWMTDAGRKRMGEERDRVQDSAVVRATNHIHGSLAEAAKYLTNIVNREANAATSSPLMFEKPHPQPGEDAYDVLSGGNWDGAMLALALDHLNQSITAVAVASERRSSRLISKEWSKGLPPSLTGGQPGVNNGFVQVQSLQLSLITEMRQNASPASVLSSPAKNYQEDTNSMANNALLKLLDQLDRAEEVVAIEILLASQGISLIQEKMKNLSLGRGTKRLQKFIRKHIKQVVNDRFMKDDVHKIIDLVRSGAIAEQAAAVTEKQGRYPF